MLEEMLRGHPLVLVILVAGLILNCMPDFRGPCQLGMGILPVFALYQSVLLLQC